MPPVLRRVIGFANAALELVADGDDAICVAALTLGGVPDASDTPPHVVLSLSSRAAGLELCRDGEMLVRDSSPGIVADLLLDAAQFHLADRSRGGLLLHAGGLERDGEGILMPGAREHGKTTAVAWLTAGGTTCLTDELVFVPDGTARLVGFVRPLRVRPPSWPILHTRCSAWPPVGSLLTSEALLVPAAALAEPRDIPAPRTGLLLFARYDPTGDGVPRPLTTAQCVLRLMACLINARNLAGHGIPAAIALAGSAPAMELTFQHCEQVEALVHDVGAWRRRST